MLKQSKIILRDEKDIKRNKADNLKQQVRLSYFLHVKYQHKKEI